MSLRLAVTFKPCVDSKENGILMPLSIRIRGAPQSEYAAPINVNFHGPV
jgi:hypothetical protein